MLEPGAIANGLTGASELSGGAPLGSGAVTNGLGGPMPLQGALPGAPHGALVPALCGRSPWRGRASNLTGAWA